MRSTVAVDLSVSGFQVAASFPLEMGQIVPVRLHLTKDIILMKRYQLTRLDVMQVKQFHYYLKLHYYYRHYFGNNTIMK